MCDGASVKERVEWDEWDVNRDLLQKRSYVGYPPACVGRSGSRVCV